MQKIPFENFHQSTLIIAKENLFEMLYYSLLKNRAVAPFKSVIFKPVFEVLTTILQKAFWHKTMDIGPWFWGGAVFEMKGMIVAPFLSNSVQPHAWPNWINLLPTVAS